MRVLSLSIACLAFPARTLVLSSKQRDEQMQLPRDTREHRARSHGAPEPIRDIRYKRAHHVQPSVIPERLRRKHRGRP